MSNGFAVTITAVDRVTATIDKINKRMAAMQAPFERMNKAFARFSDLSGLTKLRTGLAGVASAAERAFRGVGQILAPLGAITGAASLAGMYRMVSAWSGWATQLNFTAQRLGVTGSQLNQWQGAARLAGSSSEALTAGMGELTQRLNDAAWGRNPEAAAFFHMIGAEGKTAAEVMPLVADKVQAVKNPMAKLAIATEAFGAAGAGMLPFLNKGRTGIAELMAIMQRYNPVSQRQIEAADQFRIAQMRLTLATEGLGNAIAAKLAPVLVPMLTELADWVAKHRNAIAGFFGDVAKRIEAWVKGGGIQRVQEQLTQFALKVDGIVQKLGGWQAATETILELYIGAKFAGMLTGVARLVWLLSKIPGLGVAGLGAAALALTGFAGGEDEAFSRQKNEEYVNAHPRDRRMFSMGPDSPTQNRLGQEAMRYFVGQGWSPEQAAGIVGNLRQESGFDVRAGISATGVQSAHIGLAQWSADRQKDIEDHFHKSVAAMGFQDQLAAINYELREGKYKRAGDILSSRVGVENSSNTIDHYYEIPGNYEDEDPRRAAFSNAALQAYYASKGRPTSGEQDDALSSTMSRLRLNTAGLNAANSGAPPAGNMQVETHVTVNGPPGTRATATSRARGDGVDAAPPKVRSTSVGVDYTRSY